MKKRISLILPLLFVFAQLLQPKQNVAEAGDAHYNQLAKQLNIPANVQSVLVSACYDCHSDNTRYPWYSKITPVNFFMAHHVDEGKEHFNFSEFQSYPANKLDHKLEEMIEEIEKEKMPLKSYLITHHDAKLADEQKELLINWATQQRATIAQ